MVFDKRIKRSIQLTLGLFCCVSILAGPPASIAAKKKKSPSKVTAKKVKKAAVNDGSQALESGLKEMISGKPSEAEKLFRKGLADSEKAKSVKVQINCLQMLSESLEAQRKVADAQPLRQKALELAKQKYGAESSQYAAQLAGMSSWFTKKGNNAKSWSFIEQANDVLAKAGGSYANPIAGADCKIATGRIQALEGSRGLADMSFQKALELRESKLKESDPLVLLVCKEYANLLEQMEDRKNDIKRLRDRLAVATAVGAKPSTADDDIRVDVKVDGKDSDFGKLVVAAKKAQLAKDYDTALAKWQRVAQISEKAGKKGRLAYALLKIGDVYSMKKQQDKVAALYKRSAVIRESIKATETIGMARVLNRLANIEMRKKNYAESKRLLQRALVLMSKNKASNTMVEMTLRSLSAACMLTKDFGEGEKVCQRLISLASNDNGPTAGTKKAMATSTLAGIYMQSGRTQQGLSMMKSVSGFLTPQATKEYGKITTQEYTKAELEVDAAEEKSLGIM